MYGVWTFIKKKNRPSSPPLPTSSLCSNHKVCLYPRAFARAVPAPDAFPPILTHHCIFLVLPTLAFLSPPRRSLSRSICPKPHPPSVLLPACIARSELPESRDPARFAWGCILDAESGMAHSRPDKHLLDERTKEGAEDWLTAFSLQTLWAATGVDATSPRAPRCEGSLPGLPALSHPP